jgi:hypothetical protein
MPNLQGLPPFPERKNCFRQVRGADTRDRSEKFFLPTQAEILSCERGANVCGRNVIEFRNYHRFTGETKIIFDK